MVFHLDAAQRLARQPRRVLKWNDNQAETGF